MNEQIEGREIQRSKLDKINKKLSPATAVIGGVLLFDGSVHHSSNTLVIGASLALLAGVGIYDRVVEFKQNREPKVVFDSANLSLNQAHRKT